MAEYYFGRSDRDLQMFNASQRAKEIFGEEAFDDREEAAATMAIYEFLRNAPQYSWFGFDDESWLSNEFARSNAAENLEDLLESALTRLIENKRNANLSKIIRLVFMEHDREIERETVKHDQDDYYTPPQSRNLFLPIP